MKKYGARSVILFSSKRNIIEREAFDKKLRSPGGTVEILFALNSKDIDDAVVLKPGIDVKLFEIKEIVKYSTNAKLNAVGETKEILFQPKKRTTPEADDMKLKVFDGMIGILLYLKSRFIPKDDAPGNGFNLKALDGIVVNWFEAKPMVT